MSYSLISIEYYPPEFSGGLDYNLSVGRKVILLVRNEKLVKIKEFLEELRMKEFFFQDWKYVKTVREINCTILRILG